MYFLISSLTSWLAHSFFSRMFFNFQVFMVFPSFFLVVDLKFHSVMVWKYTWYDLNLFVLVEGWFVIQYLIYSGECSVFTWKENVYSAALGWNVLNLPVKSTWFSVSFRAIVSLLIFCLDDLSIPVSRELKSPTITVLLSVSLLMFVIELYIWVFHVGA